MAMAISNTNSRILLQAAQTLGIHTQILDFPTGKIKLTYQGKSYIVHKTGFHLNAHSSLLLTRDKLKTLQLLSRHHLPVPSLSSTQFPLVVKPVSGQKGQYVFLNIRNQAQLDTALKTLQKLNTPILTQPFLEGKDLRFFTLANQVIGIVHRQPPTITGNGHSTIRKLIDAENLRRLKLTKKSGRRMLNRLRNWPRIRWYLNQQGYNLTSILPDQKTITLYPLANFSTGGSAHALTKSQVHPSLTRLAQQAVKLTGLTVAGVDMIVKDFTKPASAKGRNAYILEINSDPSLRLHDWPNTGKSQHVAEKLLQYIFSA